MIPKGPGSSPKPAQAGPDPGLESPGAGTWIASIGGPLALLLLIVGLEAWGDPASRVLGFQRSALDSGEIWRLVSAHFVHLGPYHLGLNVAGLAAWWLLCAPRWSWKAWLGYLWVLALVVGVGLYVSVPSLERYVGFSGILHGLFVLGLWPAAIRREVISLVALIAVVAKVLIEQLLGVSFSDEEALGARVIVEAHGWGVVGALLLLSGQEIGGRLRSTGLEKSG